MPFERWRRGLGLVLAALLWMACGSGEPEGFRLPLEEGPCPPDCTATGFEFSSPPRFAFLARDNEARPAILSRGSGWRWRGRVPAGGRLSVGAQTAAEDFERFELRLSLRRGEELEILDLGQRDGPSWLDLSVDLDRYSGEEVEIEAVAKVIAAAGETEVAWAPLVLEGSAVAATDERPNILWIVIDTLRADHLTSYGYERDTAPHIERLLASQGTLIETAYSQAPWTLPSAASYLTGRYPGDILGSSMSSFGIPSDVLSVPERLADLGYRTAGFVANPTMHRGNGFARGFQTFYTAPPANESMLRHADDVEGRVLPWLKAHQRRHPFFLYVHYLDPHDPYDNPDLVDGRSPWYPDYDGTISGKWVHGVYTGKIPLTDPEKDIAHLTALYDSEIAYVDRAVGRLLASIDPEVLSNTLIVLTSDHGEELYDHGGWKHGQTLYQEQIRVPLILRWDGRIAAGRRLPGTVCLVDLAPTLIAAAGGTPDPALAGEDLLPVVVAGEPLPRREAFAENLSSGPRRAAVVLDGKKLVRFDRHRPFVAGEELRDILWRADVERLQRTELYDLTADPAEAHNLLPSEAPRAAPLLPLVDRRLATGEGGLWLVTGPRMEGRRLRLEVELGEPTAGWEGYFLGPEDRFQVIGRRLVLQLAEGPIGSRGVRLPEAQEVVIESLEVTLEEGEILVGDGRVYEGGRLTAQDLRAKGWPRSERAALALWVSEESAHGDAEELDETRQRLRALGYL
ncbi:MAG: sulfatase [Acidobacteriota bacterium]